jgi:hypothetical protein
MMYRETTVIHSVFKNLLQTAIKDGRDSSKQSEKFLMLVLVVSSLSSSSFPCSHENNKT